MEFNDGIKLISYAFKVFGNAKSLGTKEEFIGKVNELLAENGKAPLEGEALNRISKMTDTMNLDKNPETKSELDLKKSPIEQIKGFLQELMDKTITQKGDGLNIDLDVPIQKFTELWIEEKKIKEEKKTETETNLQNHEKPTEQNKVDEEDALSEFRKTRKSKKVENINKPGNDSVVDKIDKLTQSKGDKPMTDDMKNVTNNLMGMFSTLFSKVSENSADKSLNSIGDILSNISKSINTVSEAQ